VCLLWGWDSPGTLFQQTAAFRASLKNFRIFSAIRHANAVGQKRVDGRVNGQSVTRDMRMYGRTDTNM